MDSLFRTDGRGLNDNSEVVRILGKQSSHGFPKKMLSVVIYGLELLRRTIEHTAKPFRYGSGHVTGEVTRR